MSLQIPNLKRAKELDALLKKCVKIDRENKSEAWNYWREFSEKELWRPLKFKSETDYAEKVLGRPYQWIWQQKTAARVHDTHPEVKTVAEAMALRKLAMPQRAGQPANASGGQKGVKTAETGKKPALPKDGTGIDIPPEIQVFWDRNAEIDEMIAAIKKIRLKMQKADEDGDLLFCKMDRQGTISRLIMCEEEIKSAGSFAVCPQCNGIFNGRDCICRGRGTFSEYWWKTIDEKTRKLRPIFKDYK